VRGVEVDQCPDCRGIWFDDQELARLLVAGSANLKLIAGGRPNPADDARAGRCPRDGRTLVRMRSARAPRLIVEVCAQCHGLWLDGGELAQILKT
jgi:uncharacterized protein